MSPSVQRSKPSRSIAVKAKLDYPVIDTDLHTIGRERYTQSAQEQRDKRSVRAPWWGLPAKNALDLATVQLPRHRPG